MNKSIGGYFELELIEKDHSYHPEALALNTARNAFEYLLLAYSVKKIYIPYYTCSVMLQPLEKQGISYEFYSINQQFEPIFDFNKLTSGSYFLYTNYFGIKENYINQLLRNHSNIFIDQAQAFYATKVPNSFYSARKFFGLADGAYLYTSQKINSNIPIDTSAYRMDHLIIRKDQSAEEGYSTFVKNDQLLDNQPILQMSKTTKTILSYIDYEKTKQIRIANFEYLHKHLESKNNIVFDLSPESVPLVYPLWIDKGVELRKTLVQDKIYTATYWPNVLDWTTPNDLEYKMTKNIVHLPIDQRYQLAHMKIILETISKLL